VARNIWTDPELNYLQEIARTDEIDQLCKLYNKTAKQEGWAQRSHTAIKVKLKRLGLSYRPIDGGWTCSTLAEILGIGRDRAHDWIARGLLESSRRPSKRHHRILEGNFIDFAKNYPNWLTRIPEENLSILLDKKTVDKILALPLVTKGVAIPVLSSRTHRKYRSIRHAERHEFFHRSTIHDCAILGKKTRDGDRFIALAKN
jgi:hypothetical protein